AGTRADIFEEAVDLDVVAHADDRYAAASREHQRVQTDADDRLHACEHTDGLLDGQTALDHIMRTVQTIGNHARRGQVARKLNGYKDRDEPIGLVCVLCRLDDLVRDRSQTVPAAQTKAQILAVDR